MEHAAFNPRGADAVNDTYAGLRDDASMSIVRGEDNSISLVQGKKSTPDVLLDDIDSLWDCDFARSHTRSSSSSATRTPKDPKPTRTFAPTTNKPKAAIATQALLTAAETTAVKAKSLVDALESDTLTHSVDSKKIDKCIESLQSRLEDKYMDAYASSYADSAAGDASDLPPGGDASHPVPAVADTIDDAMSLDCLMILSVCIRAHRPTTTAIRRRLIFLNRHIAHTNTCIARRLRRFLQPHCPRPTSSPLERTYSKRPKDLKPVPIPTGVNGALRR